MQQFYTKDNILKDAISLIYPVIKMYNASAYSGTLSEIATKTVNEHAPTDKLYTTDEKKEILAEVDYELRSYFDH